MSKESYLAVRAEIKKVQAQIERLKKKENKLWNKSYWTDHLVRPILDEIKTKFPQIIWDDDILLTFGIGGRCPVFGKVGEKTIDITFIPYDLNKAEIGYETGEVTNEYQKGTIGEVNGFNRKSKVIESIDEIFAFIERKIKD